MNEAELIAWREETDLPRIQNLIDEHIDENAVTVPFSPERNLWLCYEILALEKELTERQERMKHQETRQGFAVYLGINKKLFLSQYALYERLKRELHIAVERMAMEAGIEPKRKDHGNNGITDEQIERAKQYPIEDLVDVGRGGMARCISGEHDDKTPSMDCRNNFVFCHACGFHADVIAVYQKIHRATFPEAVKALQ